MKTYIVIAYLAFLGLTSCVNARCPGYDLSDFRYISFRYGDTLTYISNESDTIHLSVVDFYSRGPYEFASYPDYDCNLDTYYQTNNVNEISIREHITYGMSVKFYNDKEYTTIFANYYGNSANSNVEISDTLCNGVSYKKYLVKDLSYERKIDSFVKVDFLGITEFHDKDTGLTWTKVN